MNLKTPLSPVPGEGFTPPLPCIVDSPPMRIDEADDNVVIVLAVIVFDPPGSVLWAPWKHLGSLMGRLGGVFKAS